MNIEANTKTTTTYLVYYWDDVACEVRGSLFDDLATARAYASDCAKERFGLDFHIAAHMTTFRAETVVKEV